MQEYANDKTKGMNDYWALGYKETYEQSYEKGKGVFKDNFSLSQIWSAVTSAIASNNDNNAGAERHGGRTAGILDGNSDKKGGLINRLNPTSSFKNNAPLIKLKNKTPIYCVPQQKTLPK
jgi:hypothetical protein